MREASFTIVEPFQLGLRPRVEVSRGAKTLAVCNGLKPSEQALRRHNLFESPFELPSAISWPFPQVILDGRHLFLLYGNAIYGGWDASPIETHSAEYTSTANISTKSIPSVGVWDVATFDNTFFATNNGCLLFNSPFMSKDSASLHYFVGTRTIPAALCNLRGTLILGGFNPSSYWGSPEWNAIWGLWKSHSHGVSVSERDTIDSRYLMYSTVGGGATDWPFALELAMLGYPNLTTTGKFMPAIRSHIESGRIGFVPVPYVGRVVHLRALGANAVVYGQQGVGILSPKQDTPGFVFRPLMPIGVWPRGRVAGDNRHHVFIAGDGDVWRIDANTVPQPLLYKEFIKPMTSSGSAVVVSHDEYEDDFYISDGNECLVINKAGVGAAGASYGEFAPTSLFTHLGNLYGVGKTVRETFDVVTDLFNMRSSGVKTINVIEVAYSGLSNVRVSIRYRFAPNGDWAESDLIPVNDLGEVYPFVGGVDFQVRVTGAIEDGAKIDYVTVRYRASDKRSVRGLQIQG